MNLPKRVPCGLILAPCLVMAVWSYAAVADDQIEARLDLLDLGQSKIVRLKAIKYLQEKSSEKVDISAALPALRSCLADEDADIRRAAVTAIALDASVGKKPCPLPVLLALRDSNESVREGAALVLGLFEEYPQESLAILLEAAERREPVVLRNILSPLVIVGGKDERVLRVLKRETASDDLHVRYNAFVAMWQATGELKPVVRHWLWCIEQLHSTPEGEYPPTHANVNAIAAMHTLRHRGEQQPKELVPVLVQLLGDEAEEVRRAAARNIAAVAGINQESKAVVQASDAKQALKALAENDPDRTVRMEACSALQQFRE